MLKVYFLIFFLFFAFFFEGLEILQVYGEFCKNSHSILIHLFPEILSKHKFLFSRDRSSLYHDVNFRKVKNTSVHIFSNTNILL